MQFGCVFARMRYCGRGIGEREVEKVWTAIALHTTPGIPEFMAPGIALATAGVEMDVPGIRYETVADINRESVVAAHPRTVQFKEEIADKEPHFHLGNFCSVIRASAWKG